LRRPRDEADFTAPASLADIEALNQAENKFIQRMNKQLSIERIGAWLDRQGGKEKILTPTELINDEDSYIRFVYALLYGDSRNNLGYYIEENEDSKPEDPSPPSVRAGDYVVPDIRFRKGQKV